ncbi:nuclear transport factor 2 family protein [Flaviaesturariibacter flavus]|uniref:Nuclear transport factor 2 family protein n=1 Tax=Flaviaesturariibacter flavus TaxID=2502780 RepID=A0A4R1B3W6_9BACT|nr:SnoaL-like domain-containing protein [Flaviaesturariibacter flavus]TCJ12150.1 nuclear transport factor 2 family protein [Flaviaesturariibacter flavus]
MTRTEIESSLTALNQLVLEGKVLEAFEKYYHSDVTMQENNLLPTISKSANREREIAFLDNIVEFRNAQVKSVAIGDNVSFVQWHYDYTHKEWGVRNYTQVSVQHWKDGQIISEQFIYSN